MNRLLYIFFATFLAVAACKTKNVVKTEEPKVKPSWLLERPVNSAYYIGIGTCSKISQPLDYQAIAKKLALNDLATEISVKVEGQTFFNTMEVNKAFSENFTSNISTTSNEQLEDFEIAGVYEDKELYAVYYRLNRMDYQAKKNAKKQATLQSAYDFLIKGREAKTTNNIPSAIDLFYHGLFALKPYWKEVNKYTDESGKEIILDNELFSEIRGIIADLRFETNTKTIVLSAGNNFSTEVPILVTYQGRAVRGINVRYVYQKDTYMKPKTVMSDNDGIILAYVENANMKAKSNALELSIVVDNFVPQDIDMELGRAIINGINTDQRRIPIEVQTPSFWIESNELLLNNTKVTSLAEGARNGLVSRGMRIATNINDADYLLKIETTPRRGEDIQGFKVAYLDGYIRVIEIKTQNTTFEHSISGVKGIQLSHENATIEAYKKEKEEIETNLIPALLKIIL